MDPEGHQLPDLPEVKPLFYQEEVHVCVRFFLLKIQNIVLNECFVAGKVTFSLLYCRRENQESI